MENLVVAIRKRRIMRSVWAVVCLNMAAGLPAADDWPQWRCDANRSAATDSPGPAESGLLWQLKLERPDPAYDHQYRMCADVTYAPIAAAGLVFIPSNVTDQLLACDLQTGVIRWRFFAQGPVRLAPVYWRGNVYFVSDDGHLYCVTASDGTLRWKLRGVPDALPDSRMLVNGRLCSRWPARGAPVEHNGLIYFGAGVWPEEGVYVSAVDGATGKLAWRSDAMSYIKQGMSDHGRAYDLSLPPQGYLAVIDDQLAVPSGRSLAAWFELRAGVLEPYTCFYVKTAPPRGTWYLSGMNHYCVQGGNWFGTRADASPPLPAELAKAKLPVTISRDAPENELYVLKHRPFLNADTYRLHNENSYTEPVLTATRAYMSEYTDESKYLVPRGHTRVAFPDYDRIVARDLTRPRWTSTVQPSFADNQRKLVMPRLEFPVVWQLASPLRVLIKAQDRLYAGGKNALAAIAIPAAGEAPRIAWQATLDGTPVYALVSAEKLVVATDNGNVFCFGSQDRKPTHALTAGDAPRTSTTSPRTGYACLLGWGDGAHAKSLARKSAYRVIVIEPDPAIALVAQKDLALAGIPAQRVQIVRASLETVTLAPYWATLIHADFVDRFGNPDAVLAAALDWLRPYSGKLVLAKGHSQSDIVKRLLATRAGYTLQAHTENITIHREAPPTGTDAWSHESGGPANCYANSEQLVKWPLGVLWYSGDVDRYFTPDSHFQHERQPYPLVVGGRMFLITGQFLHAIDIYTGDYLWKAEMPLTPWVQTRFFDSRVYGRPTERNYVAAVDWVYVVTGETIVAYDAASGRQVKTFDLPARFAAQARATLGRPQVERYMGVTGSIQSVPAWTEVRVWNDLLVTVFGHTVVALDRHSGEVRWTRDSTRQSTTYAMGADRLFGFDYDVPPRGGKQPGGPMSGLLFALDAATGRVVWQKQPEYPAVPKHEVEYARPWLLPIVPELAYNARHALVVLTVNRNSVYVFRAADGAAAWSKTNPSLKDIQRVYPPVVADDYLALSDYKGCFAYLLNIATGQELGENTGIPHPRTCARIIGNNNLLMYRNAATEIYDIAGDRMIELNSLRSGCTTSFIPAGGVVTAPMLGHGCVCNYPMFASLGLYHCPELDGLRPAAVTKAWGKQQPTSPVQNAPARAAASADPFAMISSTTVDLRKFHLINATIENAGAGFTVSTADQNAGYAVRTADRPVTQAVFSFSVKRAAGKGRHGNAFFICGAGEKPADWIECRLYYGGRRSMAIAGSQVLPVEMKLTAAKTDVLRVTVRVDCQRRTVAFEVGSDKLTSELTGSLKAITHYGCGGVNADNVFTEIGVQ